MGRMKNDRVQVGTSFRYWLEEYSILIFFQVFFIMIATPFFMLYLLIYSTTGRYFVVAYFVWWYIDRLTPERGSRRSKFLTKCMLGSYTKTYFPLTIHKTAELPADKNYIFGHFPHGIHCFGARVAIFNDYHSECDLFPGLKFHGCATNALVTLPLVRDINILSGIISSSFQSLQFLFDEQRKGNVAMISIGGAKEKIHTCPGLHKIFLKNRKGFCRAALKLGACLVPVYVFGENDLYDIHVPEKGSVLHYLQILCHKVTGTVPTITKRLLPKRLPLDVVVGSPIFVKKIAQPTDEEVNELHAKFMKGLIELFNKEKYKYCEKPDEAELQIL